MLRLANMSPGDRMKVRIKLKRREGLKAAVDAVAGSRMPQHGANLPSAHLPQPARHSGASAMALLGGKKALSTFRVRCLAGSVGSHRIEMHTGQASQVRHCELVLRAASMEHQMP